MAVTKLALMLFFIFFFFSFISSSLAIVTTSWCNKTPYPEQCKHYTQNAPGRFVPERVSELGKMAIGLAIHGALQAQSHNKWLGPKCRNHKERAAWDDCLKLYQETIHRLNRTAANCTDSDRQTWLGAALTNLDTCRTGFAELGVTDYVFQLMYNSNVTKLVSNALALINNNASSSVTQDTTPTDGQGFPSWVTAGDRRLLQSDSPTSDVTVAQDGSGNFRTIKQALDAAAKRSGSKRFVIYVKRGVYQENLEIGSGHDNIMMVGDGLRYTIITGSRSVAGGSTTFNSATVAVTGDGFIARGITFQNTAGPQNHQAVALRSGSDLSVFYRCGFEGYQDTLYVHSERQFYKECYIYGTVDFIFGNAAVVLQNCMIYARRPMSGQKNVITAQGRTDPNQNTGISIHNSRVMASPDLQPVVSSFKSYLGRPWKQYSRTVFLQTYLDTIIDPAGWLEWDGNFALSTLYYGEYKNLGPAASTSSRVKWPGYRVITSTSEASKFTIANFLAGQSWLPATGVPFTAGL